MPPKREAIHVHREVLYRSVHGCSGITTGTNTENQYNRDNVLFAQVSIQPVGAL